MSKLWTVQETAKFFSVTPKCVDNWCREGNLTKKKFGGVVRITLSSIEDFYNSSN